MSDKDLILRGDVRAKMGGSYISHQALNAIPAVQVGVKQLEWRQIDEMTVKADAFGCASFYVIRGATGDWEVIAPRGGSLLHYEDGMETQAAAKRWAQSDYEARIRSALTVQLAPVQAPEVAALVEAHGKAAHKLALKKLRAVYAKWVNEECETVDVLDAVAELFPSVRAALAKLEGRHGS